MLSTICKEAKTNKIYTNHSIRVTYITELKDQGFTNKEICNVTGHKKEQSVDNYDRRKRERTLSKMSRFAAQTENMESTSSPLIPVTTVEFSNSNILQETHHHDEP